MKSRSISGRYLSDLETFNFIWKMKWESIAEVFLFVMKKVLKVLVEG